ncbi:hypothetical protein [Kitasatospora camelliae]|uniref:Nucleic acid/nucleotide deaminase of polymorphic system toxin n=1 Tax=Kitasatospora camelliae TaxID=3156397 RepID=A0AAU8JQ61_9ACTN
MAPAVLQLVAEHDRLFPEVAARCPGTATPRPDTASPVASPTASPTASPQVSDGPVAPVDPENAKYRENHAYRTTVEMNAAATCRGEAHAARVSAALAKSGDAASLTPEQVAAQLEALGYPKADTHVYRSGTEVDFDLFIPKAGPCLTGRLTSRPAVQPHGVYVEGGCTEPRGGH